jgi:hypothetical protein
MSDASGNPGRALTGLTAFATLGVITTAQQVASTVLGSVEGADAEVVAEESMALVAMATSRAIREHPQIADAIGELPFAWRDYVIGGAMLRAENPEEVTQSDDDSYARIARKMAFYQAHLPLGQIPGPRLLKDKMELWMGRVSPPGLPEPPYERLAKLGLVDLVVTHVRLVRTYVDSLDGQ